MSDGVDARRRVSGEGGGLLPGVCSVDGAFSKGDTGQWHEKSDVWFVDTTMQEALVGGRWYSAGRGVAQ
jgi:hypothetical protein